MGERAQPALQLLALALAGLVGGAVGGLLVSSRSPAEAAPAARPAAPGGEAATDSGAKAVRELAGLIEVLIDEVRGLRIAPARREPAAAGSPIGAGGSELEPGQVDRLVAAIEDLARGLASGGGWSQPPPERAPAVPLLSADPLDEPREDRLLELRARPAGSMVRPHLFWTRQQVLDHFGPPERFDGLDRWIYPDPGSDDARVRLQFEFDQGLLIRVGQRLVLG